MTQILLQGNQQYPAIGTAGQDTASLNSNMQQARLALQIMQRQTANVNASMITVADLIGLGFAKLNGRYLQALSGSGLTLSDNGTNTSLIVNGTTGVLNTLKAGSGVTLSASGGNITITASGSGANPTALVGLSAVNGTATTFLRSDGAPALDVTISPAWTGNHSWSAPLTLLDESTPSAPASGMVQLYSYSGGSTNISELHSIDPFGGDIALGFEKHLKVYNNSGSTIAAGNIVYCTGSHAGYPTIGLAKANSSSTMPAIGATQYAITNNTFGEIHTYGLMTITTTGFTNGDEVYVSSSVAGAVQNTTPTTGNIIQSVGIVANVAGAGSGRIGFIFTGPVVDPFDSTHDGIVVASGGGTTNFLRADGTWAALGANPTATIGLSAVNGSAATCIRSDGAPALSQSISPTWTGNHTFTPASGVGITANGVANTNTVLITGNSTSGQSKGLEIDAGTTSADYALLIKNQSGASTFLELFGDGGLVLGGATGGDKGSGTINTTGVYVNGSSIVGAASVLTAIDQRGGTSQSYTIPSSNMHFICVIGGGGGGQAGAAGAAGTTRAGGPGGGGGGITWAIVPTLALGTIGATLTCTFGSTTGGTGGTAVSSGAGTNGTAGTNAAITNWFGATGGTAGVGGSGGSGGAGNSAPGLTGGAQGNGAAGGPGGSLASGTFFSTQSQWCCCGGGGGGGVNSSNTSFAGGVGGGTQSTTTGVLIPQAVAGTAGTTAGGNGNPGQSTKGGSTGSGGGSGGGGASTAGGTGGNGGAGGDYGGGGAGGGATTTGSGSPLSGAGGRGGYAAVVFLAW